MENFTNKELQSFYDLNFQRLEKYHKRLTHRQKMVISIIAVGFIMKYGFERIDKNLEDLIINTPFIFSNKSMHELRRSIGDVCRNKELDMSPAITSSEVEFDDDRQVLKLINRFLITTKNNKIDYNTFKILIHEMNHLVSSDNNRISEDDNFYVVRTGIDFSYIKKSNPESGVFKRKNKFINEAVNECQSTDIYNCILSLKKHTFRDDQINKYIKNLDNKQRNAYSEIVDFFKELYDDPTFKENLDASILEGDYDFLKKEINLRCNSSNAFDTYSKAMDDFYLNDNIISNYITISSINKLYKDNKIANRLKNKEKNIAL